MGFNTDTMGVAALGNYETAAAPTVMVDALAKVAGWKLSQYGVNPAGKATLTSQGGTGTKYAAGVTVSLDAVHAHQNTSYTLCPGKYLYPQMATIRSKAATYATTSSTTVAPPVPTAGLYAAYGTVTLKVGSTGNAVRDLQLELNRRGFNVGTADGDFGPMTTTGVTGFQKSAQLAATGSSRRTTGRRSRGWPTPADDRAGLRSPRLHRRWPRRHPRPHRHRRPLLLSRRVGTIGNPVRVATGWNAFDIVFSPGDFNGDGLADLVARGAPATSISTRAMARAA